MSSIFIICRDGGCEGFSAPIQACRKRETAIGLAKMLSAELIAVVFEVPIHPQYQEVPWFSLTPIWPEPKPRLDAQK